MPGIASLHGPVAPVKGLRQVAPMSNTLTWAGLEGFFLICADTPNTLPSVEGTASVEPVTGLVQLPPTVGLKKLCSSAFAKYVCISPRL